MYTLLTLKELHSMIEEDEEILEQVRLVGRAKTIDNDVLTVCDLHDQDVEVQLGLPREVDTEKLSGEIIRVLLKKIEDPKKRKLSVTSIRILKDFSSEHYYGLLNLERKVDRLISTN